jgi:hypothetical protein
MCTREPGQLGGNAERNGRRRIGCGARFQFGGHLL